MPYPRRKNAKCLNCYSPLQEQDNYCPVCGQENNDRRVSFGELVLEVLGNLFSFDSQFVRSVVPFLFRPGYLTQEFLAGRRKRYIHPLRLYFAISFVFFLLALPSFDGINEKTTDAGDTTSTVLKDTSSKGIFKIKKKKKQENQVINFEVSGMDTTEKKYLRNYFDTASHNELERWMNLLNGSSRKIIKTYKLTPDQLLDSLGLKPGWLNKLLARQTIKLAQDESGKALGSYIISKVPLMMFILMPLVALLLKLIYFGAFSRTVSAVSVGVSYGFYHTKRLFNPQLPPPDTRLYKPPRRFYVDHLIFTLHLHAFIFFVFILGELTSRFVNPETTSGILGMAAFLYMWLSFKKVYQEGWFKTTLKIFVLLIGYTFCLALCMLLILFVGVLTF